MVGFPTRGVERGSLGRSLGSSFAERLRRFVLSVAGSRDAKQEFEAALRIVPAGYSAVAEEVKRLLVPYHMTAATRPERRSGPP